MTITVSFKQEDHKTWKHTYSDVRSFEVIPKEEVINQIDSTTYSELGDYLFRLHLSGDEQATFTIGNDFEYKVESWEKI